MGNNPSYFKGFDRPVETVSWNDCAEFCAELSRMTGRRFRLPTEAEWCMDWYGNYSSNSQTDPLGASSGSRRANRGGSWNSYAAYCRVSNRGNNSPGYSYDYLGFRVVLLP